MDSEEPRFDVVGVGYSCLDDLLVLPAPPARGGKTRIRRWLREVGGQTFTALAALSRLGHRTAIATAVGQDAEGDRVVEAIRQEEIHPLCIPRRDSAPTARAFPLVDSVTGERSVLWHRHPEMALRPEELPADAGARGRVLLLDGHEMDVALRCAGEARRAGRIVVLDGEELPGARARELLQLVDYPLVSSEFGSRVWSEESPRAVLDRLICFGARAAVVTLGADGLMALEREAPEHPLRLRGHTLKAVDTTGAGDILHAGFVHGVLRGWDLRKSLAFANAFAALSVRFVGGRPGIPTLHEALALAFGQTQDGDSETP